MAVAEVFGNSLVWQQNWHFKLNSENMIIIDLNKCSSISPTNRYVHFLTFNMFNSLFYNTL